MKKAAITATIAVILALTAAAVMSMTAPKRYVRSFYYSNADELERLVECQRNGDTAQSAAIFARLRDRCQPDSELPVLTSANVQYDSDGDMLMTLTIKRRKLKNRDGYNEPDVWCLYIAYIDADYGEHTPIADTEPFEGCWYMWSADTWSG